MPFTAEDICRAINELPKNRTYHYVNTNNHGEIRITNIVFPEGPIVVETNNGGGTWKERRMGANMLWRMANAMNGELPINVDRVFGASYNTRSVLETLLAHTRYVYTCFPGRQVVEGSTVKIKRGHKHIMIDRTSPHDLGVVEERDLGRNYVVSEVPTQSNMYDIVPPPQLRHEIVDVNIARRHSQMQVCLYVIARALGMRTWFAVEDHGIRFNGQPIMQYPAVVKDLNDEQSISNYPSAIHYASHIDTICFNGGLPFAFEVEHSTGVTSGLNRMMNFKSNGPNLSTSFVIVAPDEDRNFVMQKASPSHFEDLHVQYMPYSNVEDLYGFVVRHGGKLRGVKKELFLANFMESCPSAGDDVGD